LLVRAWGFGLHLTEILSLRLFPHRRPSHPVFSHFFSSEIIQRRDFVFAFLEFFLVPPKPYIGFFSFQPTLVCTCLAFVVWTHMLPLSLSPAVDDFWKAPLPEFLGRSILVAFALSFLRVTGSPSPFVQVPFSEIGLRPRSISSHPNSGVWGFFWKVGPLPLFLPPPARQLFLLTDPSSLFLPPSPSGSLFPWSRKGLSEVFRAPFFPPVRPAC